MPELNKANRQVCDADIRVLKTKAPFLKFDTANTTTAGLTGDSVYAMAKGSRKIAFANPIAGTLSIQAQVYPFKFYSLLSDGIIETTAAYADSQIVECGVAGSLTLTLPSGGTVQTGTVFVYAADDFGGTAIAGTYSAGVFTATNTSEIAVGTSYMVGYIVTRISGVKKISFNNKKLPKDYFITMKTVEKDEDGLLTPFLMTAYKATIQRSFELSFSSEGDPASVTLNFDLLEDKDGNILDFVEIDDTEAMSVSKVAVSLVKGASASDIKINSASGNVTVVIKDSSNVTATKVHALISGDNDTIIIYADNDATAGDYTVTLTDGASQTANIIATVTNS